MAADAVVLIALNALAAIVVAVVHEHAGTGASCRQRHLACTPCSVPAPDAALAEARPVLAPGGRLLMFEHVRSRHWVLGLVLDVMTLWTQRTGTAMNRDAVAAARRAGFVIRRVESAFLDIIPAVEAEP